MSVKIGAVLAQSHQEPVDFATTTESLHSTLSLRCT